MTPLKELHFGPDPESTRIALIRAFLRSATKGLSESALVELAREVNPAGPSSLVPIVEIARLTEKLGRRDLALERLRKVLGEQEFNRILGDWRP